MRRLTILVAAVAFVALLSGCANGPGGTYCYADRFPRCYVIPDPF